MLSGCPGTNQITQMFQKWGRSRNSKGKIVCLFVCLFIYFIAQLGGGGLSGTKACALKTSNGYPFTCLGKVPVVVWNHKPLHL